MKAALTSLAMAAALFAGCASMEVVNKTPDKKVVAEILRKEAACVAQAPAPDATEPATSCGPGDEPKAVRLSEFSCEALPLKTGVLSAARAECLYAGELQRVDGRVEPIAATSREFQLLNLTPGIRRPIHEWSASPLAKTPAAKS